MDWEKMKVIKGDNKDWKDGACGCGFSISCDCGWIFTTCILLQPSDTTTNCPYCNRECVIIDHRHNWRFDIKL